MSAEQQVNSIDGNEKANYEMEASEGQGVCRGTKAARKRVRTDRRWLPLLRLPDHLGRLLLLHRLRLGRCVRRQKRTVYRRQSPPPQCRKPGPGVGHDDRYRTVSRRHDGYADSACCEVLARSRSEP